MHHGISQTPLQIEALEGNRAKVKAADGGIVFVELTKGPAFDGGIFYEFEGRVLSPNTVREESRTSYGTTFGNPPESCSDWSKPSKLFTADLLQTSERRLS